MLDLRNDASRLYRDEWASIYRKHCARYPTQECTVDSLKSDFSGLHRKRTSTGDPNYPPNATRAKLIPVRMTDRADICNADESEEASELPASVEIDGREGDLSSGLMRQRKLIADI